MTDTTPPEPPNRGLKAALLGLLATVPGVGAALLPAVACPACWPAYAGLLSSLGLGFIDYTPWLAPLTVMFLAVALLALAWQGRKRGHYRPLLLGALGSVLLLVGKYRLDSDAALYTGVALLIVASLWNAWPRKACPTDSACDCG